MEGPGLATPGLGTVSLIATLRVPEQLVRFVLRRYGERCERILRAQH